MAEPTETTSSYLDYDTLTSAEFSPTSYANSLVLQTNNPSDTPIDLSTPLSRVLFDVQETDTHIDTLTTSNAEPLISTIQTQTSAATYILSKVETQLTSLQESYARLEREVVRRHEAAEQVHLVAQRMLATLRSGRSVQRVCQLARQLEGQLEDGRNYRGMVGASSTVLALRGVFQATGKGQEGEGLERVSVVDKLKGEVLGPAERGLVSRAQQVVREFSMSSLVASGAGSGKEQTFAQTEETKSRATSALQSLYLLSPTKSVTLEYFEPGLLISALNSYLQTALTSSLAALSRALASLSTLDRTLLEVSARCQNIVALESLLETTPPPPHPLLPGTFPDANFLAPLLRHLDTSSLPSYFWRSLASQLSSRVHDILVRGGASARTLRTNRDRVRDMIRESVDRGSRLPFSQQHKSTSAITSRAPTNWEREAAVMVSSVVGPLQR